MGMSTFYTTKEAAQASGIAIETVRYYCKVGRVPRVVRDANNYRVFDEHDIARLRGLHRISFESSCSSCGCRCSSRLVCPHVSPGRGGLYLGSHVFVWV